MSCFWTDYLNTIEPDCGEVLLHLYFPPVPTAHVAYTDYACTSPISIGTATITKVQAYQLVSAACCCGCFYTAWSGNVDYSGICGVPTPGWHTTGTESPPIAGLDATFDHLSQDVNPATLLSDSYTYAAGLFGSGAANEIFVISITTDVGYGLLVQSYVGLACE